MGNQRDNNLSEEGRNGPTPPKEHQLVEALGEAIAWMQFHIRPEDAAAHNLLQRLERTLRDATAVYASSLTTWENVVQGLIQWHGYRRGDAEFALSGLNSMDIDNAIRWRWRLVDTVTEVLRREKHVCSDFCRAAPEPEERRNWRQRLKENRRHLK